MAKHGDIRNEVTKSEITRTSDYVKKDNVIQISALSEWTVKEVYCAKCEEWQLIDLRFFVGSIMCPTCCIPWK